MITLDGLFYLWTGIPPSFAAGAALGWLLFGVPGALVARRIWWARR